MKRAVFIWQISPLFSTQGAMSGSGGIQKTWAKRFCKKLEAAIKENNLDCQVILDDTDADVYEIVKKDYDIWILAPGEQKRFYIPKKMNQELEHIPKIYVDILDYYNMDITKTLKAMH